MQTGLVGAHAEPAMMMSEVVRRQSQRELEADAVGSPVAGIDAGVRARQSDESPVIMLAASYPGQEWQPSRGVSR